MAIKDIFKVSRKTFFNPGGWVGYNQVKSNTTIIWDIIRGLVYPMTPERSETFEAAMQRLNQTENDIQTTGQTYFEYALVFLFLGACLAIYSFYLLFFHRTFSGFLLGIASGALFLSQAFKYHFWYFQIKQRKLGCTFQDWWQYILATVKGPHA